MKKIQNMLKLKPEAEKLNLSFLQIESLDDIIYELFHFEKLKEIDLSCNRLRKLPIDLSVLKTIERIDLTNNLFDNIEQVLADEFKIELSEAEELKKTQGEITFDATKPDGTPRKWMDSSRLNALGWKPTVNLAQGLARAYADFMQYGDVLRT